MTEPLLVERAATRDDLQAVTDLYCANELAVRGAPDTDPGDVLADWDSPDCSLADGTLVLEAGGRVVGYAVALGEEVDSCLDPAGPVAEVQHRLLTWLEAHGDRNGVRLEHYVPDADSAASAAFAERGWSPARRFWRMRRELDAPSPAPRWPDGVVVRDHVRPSDDRPVHALITAAFAEIGGQHERTFAQWSAFLLDAERFDPSLTLVATRDGQVVGAALAQATGHDGFIRQLAVAPAERGRGLGLALLHECFARHRARGLPATVLGVDAANPTGALALYERAGMRVVEEFTRWERAAPA